MKKLEGLNVVFFESRLSKTLGDLIALQGGRSFSAPSMKEVPIENNPHAFAFAEKLLRREIDLVVFLTGVGVRALMSILETRYKRETIVLSLRKMTIIPRGPKPIKALHELSVPYAVTVPEPNTWREILKVLDENREKIPLKDKVVAVQEYGVANPELVEGLKKRGAKVLSVPVYRWMLPDDLGPLKTAISSMASGEVHVAVFTTAVQVEHVFKVASEMGLENELKDSFRKIVVASVGPDCTESLLRHGLSVDIQPASPKMGPLVQAVAEKAREVLLKK
ncbi:MAG: uroporphyrinogen-III synthase [Candidatus Omnitrophica bacterium]|nr:uroporphyrinogen-III synthase [Candidatus Omnitrophota bacterium]